MTVERFYIYGRGEVSAQGNLYDVDEVHEALLQAINAETKDDIVKNICDAFGISKPDV
jgi:hypothetical protein